MTIKTLQLKLPTSHQDKWSNKVQKIRRELSREPLFEDFVLFIEFESSVLADPFFSRHTSGEKKAINVNNTLIKEAAKSENMTLENKKDRKPAQEEKSAQCIVCDQAHDLDSCKIFAKKGNQG